MGEGAITALVLAIAGLVSSVGLVIRDALKRRRDSERPDPPPRPPLSSYEQAADTGPYPALGPGGYPPAPVGLPPPLAATLERLEMVIAGLSGYARSEDIQALRNEMSALGKQLESYLLQQQQLGRAHETTRQAVLALQQSVEQLRATVHEQAEQIGRLASELGRGRAQ